MLSGEDWPTSRRSSLIKTDCAGSAKTITGLILHFDSIGDCIKARQLTTAISIAVADRGGFIKVETHPSRSLRLDIYRYRYLVGCTGCTDKNKNSLVKKILYLHNCTPGSCSAVLADLLGLRTHTHTHTHTHTRLTALCPGLPD